MYILLMQAHIYVEPSNRLSFWKKKKKKKKKKKTAGDEKGVQKLPIKPT